MDIQILQQILEVISVPKEEIEKYIEDYIEIYSVALINTLLSSLKELNIDKERSEIIAIVNDMKNIYSSLDIADEAKQENLLQKLNNVLEEVNNHEKRDIINYDIERELTQLDKRVVAELVKSLSEVDRQKITDLLKDIDTSNHPK